MRPWFRNLRSRHEVAYRGVLAFATALRLRTRTGKRVIKPGEYRCRRCREHGHFTAGGTFPTCVEDSRPTVWFWRGPYRGENVS
jgi:hypothetical protein